MRIPVFLAVILQLPATTWAAPPVTATAFTPDKTQVVLGSQAGVEIRSWPELEVVATLSSAWDHIHDVRFSPNGTTLLVAGGAPSDEGGVEVWNWSDRQVGKRIATHEDVVYRATWSPDGTHWVTAGGDSVCEVRSAETSDRRTRYVGHSRPVLAIAYLPDGQSIVSGGVDTTVRIWDAETGEHRRTLDNHVGTVNSIAVRPGQTPDALPVIATASDDRTVRLWQPTIGRLVRFAKLPSIPRAIAWSQRGDRMFVGCDDGQIRVLDPDNVEILKTLEGPKGRIFELLVDATGKRLLVAGQGGCRLIEM